MDNRRVFLFAALVFIGFLIYQAWMQDYGPKPEPAAETPATQTVPAASTGTAGAVAAAAIPGAVAAPTVAGREIHVRTDVLDLVINTAGGDIRRADLLEYPEDLKNPDKHVRLLDDADAKLLVMQSGLQTSAGVPVANAVYTASHDDYFLSAGTDALDVSLSWQDGHGLKVDKTYHLKRGSYEIGLSYAVHNDGSVAWSGAAYTQWESRYTAPGKGFFNVARYDYQRLAVHGADGYQQYEFNDLADKPLSATQPDGWMAVVEHYFLAAVIAPAAGQNLYYAKALGDGRYVSGVSGPAMSVAAGGAADFTSRLYIGPKLQTKLAAVAPGLELTVDYGKLTILAQPIFWVLDHIERLVKNWGWSILLLTVLFKALTYKLNEISGRSMAKMRQVQPRIKAIQERYADDRQRMSQAMMDLYKKEKINPASGCFPILIQIPIFFALYYVLVYSVELRHAPWMLWIQDLSAPDPYWVLPFVYGGAMFIQTHLQPQPADKTQALMMKIMPVALIAMYIILPSGLVLYYLANSLITIAQQRYINNLIEKETKKAKT